MNYENINTCDIMNNIDFIYGDNDICEFIKNKDHINVLWGLQPRDLPTIEFCIPILKIVEFLKQNLSVTILIADVHEMLDSPRLDLELLKFRGEAYIELIKNMVELFNGNPYNIKFIYGSEFQTSSSYVYDLYKISSLTTIEQTYRAREIENIENIENITNIDINSSPLNNNSQMTTMLYPILQALDEKYTNCDIFYGSITQKNMCIYSESLMDKFGKKNKVIYLLQDLTKKIDISFFDLDNNIQYKIENYTKDDILYLNKYILWPIIHNLNDKMIYNDIVINNYDELNDMIISENVTTNDLIKLTSTYLTKHLYKIYDIIIESKFRYNYTKGWIGVIS